MDWIIKGLLAILVAYLLDRLRRLLAANRRMQSGVLNILEGQLKELEQEVGATPREKAGIRKRAATLMQQYQNTLDQINEIEGRKNVVFTAFSGVWTAGKKAVGYA